MSSYTMNESHHALQVDLSSDRKPQDQSQSGLLGERVAGMLLMISMVDNFNLLPKVRVEALDELACAIDRPHLFKYERVDSSPEPTLRYKS